MRSHLILLSLSLACYSEQGAKVHNSIPEVQITSHPDKIELNEMEEVIFLAQVSDSNHDNSLLEASWMVNEEIVCDWETPQTGGLTDCRIQFVEGMERVSAVVRDPSGSAATSIVEVQIILSTPPEVTLLSPLSSRRYYSNTQVPFEAQLADVDEPVQNLLVEWRSSEDGVLTLPQTIDSNGVFLGATLLSEGEHYIELTVTDQANKSTTLSQIIDVGPPNEAPECSFDSPIDGVGVSKGEAITFSGTATDTEIPSEDLIVRWISDIDGVFGESHADSTGNISYSYDGLGVGTHTVTLHVEDDAGAVCSHNMLVHVGTPPQLIVTNPTDGAILKYGETLLIEGSVVDNEDQSENLTFEWSSDIDGVLSNSGADSNGNISFSTAPLSAGEHSIHVIATDPIGLFATETVTITINQVPSAPVVDLIPQPATSANDLSVLASGSLDPEGSSVSYQYTWYQDTNLTSFTSVTVPYSNTAKGELWTVRVTPTDGFHDGPYTESSVIIANTAPQADSLTISPSSAYNTDTLTCVGVSSDLDGDSITENYIWRNGSTDIALGDTIDLSQYSIVPGDEVVCVLTLDDGTDQVEETTSLIIGNHAPVISSVSITPSTAFNDTTLSCTVTASDSDGDILTQAFSWYNDSNGQFLGSQDVLTLDSSLASALDAIRCEASVQDSSGETDASIQSITLDNRAPTINSLSFDPNDLQMNSLIDCVVDAEDPDDDSLSYSFEWSNITTGTVIGTTQALTLDFSMGTGGDELSCTTVVTDVHGQNSTAATQGFINRTKPEFDVAASIVPVVIDTNSFVTCSASASDPDGTVVTLSYEWNNITTGTVLGSSDTLQLTPFLTSPTDDLQCLVTATDGNQETENSSITANIINTPPALSNINITPNSGVLNENTLTCAVSVLDADGEILTPSFIWYNGSTPIGIGDTITLDSSIALPGDTLICEAEATDSYGGNTSTNLSVSIDNRPPVLDSLTIQASTLFNDGTLSCVATYSDPDQENVTASYEWKNTNSGIIIGTADSITLDSSMGSPQDVIDCSVTITDDFGDSTSGQSNITLENRPPDTPTVSLSPATLHIDSTISCDALATDPDNDVLLYAYSWSQNGTPIAPTAQTLSASIFTVGDSLSCTATVSDGIDTSFGSSAPQTIENKPPEITGLTFDTASLFTDDLLGMSYTLNDADGDPITFIHNWSVNGTLVQTGSQTTLDGLSSFDKGDTISLEVQADDGINPLQNESITIECINSLPLGHTLDLVSHIVEGESDLTCAIDQAANDADGDTLFYQFSWTVDGAPFTQATDYAMESVVATSALITDETWVCSVDVLDNDGTGSNAHSSTIVVEPWTTARTFTSCGAEGAFGPTQVECEDSYFTEALNREILLNDGAQLWTVPQDGTYLIEAYGAQGGSTTDADGGLGAYMSAAFTLSFGDELTVYVGQSGSDAENGGAGGGGGSFVLLNGSPILIAGGGGGAMQTGVKFANGLPASILESGVDGQTGLSGVGPTGGQNGSGGLNGDASGGAGLLENGFGSYGGLSLSNGLLGGDSPFYGGFGGGAGSEPGFSGSGGGGYSGGGGGNTNVNLGVGGGGGSLNLGSNQLNSEEVSSFGTVIVDLVP